MQGTTLAGVYWDASSYLEHANNFREDNTNDTNFASGSKAAA